MISKMKFINIIGPNNDFERIVSKYVMGSEIEFENPMTALKSTAGFVPSTQKNPAENIMRRFTEVFDYAGIDYKGVERNHDNFSKEELVEIVSEFDSEIHSLKERMGKLEREIKHSRDVVDKLSPIVKSEVHLETLGKLKNIKYRFGRLPMSNYEKLESYLKDLPVYFTVMTTDKDFIWGIYFVSESNSENVDRIFATMYFERLEYDDEEEGTPAEIIEKLKARNAENEKQIKELKEQIDKTVDEQREHLLKAYADIKYDFDLYNIRKDTVNTRTSFCITGWVTEDEAERMFELAEGDNDCMIIADEPEAVSHIKTPTKLKNPRIFKPFEDFVKMYGMPRYNELDPTVFLGIVYTLLFGIMFGDVGHGLCLALIGALMIAFKKRGLLSRLLIPIGLSSALFGFVYGSFFGLEGEHAIIKPLWFTPFENSETMMNTLIYAVVIGVALILLCMVFNIVNGVRQKDFKKILFSQNGIAGMLFYALVVYLILSMVIGGLKSIGGIVAIILISLALIFLQEPLGRLVERKKDWIPKDKGGFLMEAFFETFEIILSFVTNSVSFLRVGAFALNHAGMMSVVVMFMFKLSMGGSIAIAIFGNALVIGLEGLIVGIQVLRLGFYEMFSRFYDGDGREFKPLKKI